MNEQKKKFFFVAHTAGVCVLCAVCVTGRTTLSRDACDHSKRTKRCQVQIYRENDIAIFWWSNNSRKHEKK